MRPDSLRLAALLLVPLALACGARPASAVQQEEGSIRFGVSERMGYTAELFPATTYDDAIDGPRAVLGKAVGDWPAHHAEVVAYLRRLEGQSERVLVRSHGRTHEGRELVHAVIASPANLARLDAILADLARLADPRRLSDTEGRALVERTPACAWLGYSIHGDEMSGVDASLAVAHHLAAGTSADVTDLLEEVVVVLDPIMNPDGRERILSQLEQNAGYVPNLDHASMHRGRWPYGRGNHYLFDMNRDWMPGVQPETRGRWEAVARYHPQLFVDAHEMAALDTFLFYPPNEPINKNVPSTSRKWWKVFGDEQAAAFDAHGWSYYTREWAEYWYPGYSDSWATYRGAVGILYEQARYLGQAVRRESGEVATYREAVHHQAIASVANVASLAHHRADILADYLAARRRNVGEEAPDRTFVVQLGRHPDREARFVSTLVRQGVEVFRADEGFTTNGAVGALGDPSDERSFEAGVLLVPTRQPEGPLAHAYLDFDPRYDDEALAKERRDLERKYESHIYDLTGWSLPLALDLDAYVCEGVDAESTRIESLGGDEPGVVPAPTEGPVYGWLVDGRDDRAVSFAARAMEAGLAVHFSDEPFSSAGRAFVRGSLLVRRHENADDAAERVGRAAREAGVRAFATTSGRSPDDGPDLGGGHFHLLARPRIALLGNAPVRPDTYGHTWHALDVELGVPFTLLDAQGFGEYDLRRYNVLVLPPGQIGSLLKEHADALKAWIHAGGTLVATGASAAAVAKEDLGLSAVRLRRDALDDLESFAWAAKLEREAGSTPIDAAEVYDAQTPDDVHEPEKKDEPPKTDVDPDAERLDRWQRVFAPHGVILRGEVDADEWITAGCEEELPVNVSGSHVLLAARPVHTPVRLAAAERLRLSGLLWPEARERLADSAYVTVERAGAGQVILFATHPGFRGLFRGTGRLFANAVIYGPGVGASQPGEW